MGLFKFTDGRLHKLIRKPPPFSIYDVGCSGGIQNSWRYWNENLSGIGFDMIGSEIDRLRKSETNSGIKYNHVMLGSDEAKNIIGRSSVETKSNYPVHRTSGYLATSILAQKSNNNFQKNWLGSTQQKNPPTNAAFANHETPGKDPYISYYSNLFAQNEDPNFAERRANLDDEIPADSINKPSFLKIDVDGYELDVLKGAKNLLQSGHLIGVEVETQFHGPATPGGGVFSEVDLLLRDAGFTLFDLETVRHGRSALPRPFAISVPAETTGGPLQWANALYFKDLGDPLFKDKWPRQWSVITNDHLKNLVLLFDIFGLQDAGAEIMLKNPDLFNPECTDVEILNLLSERIYGEGMLYKNLTSTFNENPKSFCTPYCYDDRSKVLRLLKRIIRRFF
jgi:FkbM family methyltransferase